MPEPIVIVGAGQAAFQCIVSLRHEGWRGKIVLVGEEAYLPYHRPPLSKGYLSNEVSLDKLSIAPVDLYEKKQVDRRLETTVTMIDRANKCIHTEHGESIAYDKLCLAIGVRARQLQRLEGADLMGIFYLRTLVDINRIKHYMSTHQSACRVVLIGGGYIGLETAASLTKKGYTVTILEAGERILGRVTSPIISDFFSRLHQQQGVEIYTHVELECFLGENAQVRAVVLVDGRQIEADIVLVGIGVEVNDELAHRAELRVEDGIVVNSYCQTDDADIFAIGDCTWHYNPMYRRWLRLESVQHANDQAKVAARAMIHGQVTEPYNRLPWFWSDQYDVMLQMAGLSDGYDDYQIDGKIADKNFSLSYYCDGKLIAVDTINCPRTFMQAKKQIVKALQST